MEKLAWGVFVLLAGCGVQNNDRHLPLSKLLSVYQDTTFSQMYVYPDTAYIDSLYFFRGSLIDSATFRLLQNQKTVKLSGVDGFYGLYSFKMNEENIGLLTRVPSKYASTMVSLWIYDAVKDSIVNSIQLSDVVGDAGYVTTFSSYLFFDDQKQLNILTYEHFEYDHSIEDESDRTFEENHIYYLTRINAASADTLSTDSIKLNTQFQEQLRKMSVY
jgi:hypothetical protein